MQSIPAREGIESAGKDGDVRAVRLLTCKKLRFRVGSAFAKFFSDSSNHPFVVLAVDRR